MLNKVILIGNVGIDPEVRYINDNTPVANFTLATSETYKNRDGEKVTDTQWHKLVLWRKTAEIAEKYVKKGSRISVEGKIVYRSYEDKDGVKKYITEIVVDKLILLGNKKEEEKPETQNDYPDYMLEDKDKPQLSEDDDLPF